MKILQSKIIIIFTIILLLMIFYSGVYCKEIKEYSVLPVKPGSEFSSSEFDVDEYIKSNFDIIGEVHYVDKKKNTIVVDDTELKLSEGVYFNLSEGDFAGVKLGENGKVVSVKKLSRKY